MKYYVAADVHGFYTEFHKALEEAGYFTDPDPHKLIILGDIFDRKDLLVQGATGGLYRAFRFDDGGATIEDFAHPGYRNAKKYAVKPAIAGLIFAAGLAMMNAQNFVQIGKGENNISIVICVLAFVASYFFKANPILLIVLSGVVGFFVY